MVVAAVAWLPPAFGGAMTGAELPPGCEGGTSRLSCSWAFSSEPSDAGPTGGLRYFPIPVFAKSLATVTVMLDGIDSGWGVRIREGGREVAYHTRNVPASPGPAQVVRESSTHLLALDLRLEHDIELNLGGPECRGVPYCVGRFVASSGQWRIVYDAEPLSTGVPPVRPAATAADPHLQGFKGDATEPGFDLLAAWLDDDEVGDALFDAHLQVDSLEAPGARRQNGRTAWSIAFSVTGHDYTVLWREFQASPPSRDCVLARGRMLESADLDVDELATGLCEFDDANGRLDASFPIRSIGSPGDGVPFTSMASTTSHRPFEGLTGTSMDRMEPERYAFALGGPDVWDQLNPRLKVTVPMAQSDPWYEHPLAAENIPNTLQVGAAAAALVTFVVGLFLLQRRRRRTQRLLKEVDDAVRPHTHDASAALVALGDLEESLDVRLKGGRVTEAEYQIASQRVATAATRLAMRHGLGLDDGAPGDAPKTRKARPPS